MYIVCYKQTNGRTIFFIFQDNNIPRGVDATAQMCCSLLSNPNTKPMILFIDALHQVKKQTKMYRYLYTAIIIVVHEEM